MTAIILLVIHRVASVVPWTLLALAFAFAIVVAVIWPSQARQDMVERLGTALKDFGSGMSRPPVQQPGLRGLRRTSEPAGDQAEQ
jgi:hypothetical protein